MDNSITTYQKLTALVGRILIAAIFLLSGLDKISAMLFTGFSVGTALMFHFDLANQVQYIMFMKNIAIVGVAFLFLVANGAGAYSIDKYLQDQA